MEICALDGVHSKKDGKEYILVRPFVWCVSYVCVACLYCV